MCDNCFGVRSYQKIGTLSCRGAHATHSCLCYDPDPGLGILPFVVQKRFKLAACYNRKCFLFDFIVSRFGHMRRL